MKVIVSIVQNTQTCGCIVIEPWSSGARVVIKSTVAPQTWLSYVPLITLVFAVNAVALVKIIYELFT